MNREVSNVTLRKKELIETLIHKNTVRAFYSALVFSIVVPVFLLIVQFSGLYGIRTTSFKTILAVFESIQIISAIIGYILIHNNEQDRMSAYYRTYLFATFTGLVIIASKDVNITGSVLFYIVSSVYMIMVPILMPVERRYYMYPLALTEIITIAASKAPGIEILDIVITALVTLLATVLVHTQAIDNERISLRLKAKTITAELDPLTKLSNRRGLDKKANVIWPYCVRNSTPVGIIEIDIDFFKKYNDKFGHPAGDKCLKMVANAIRKSATRGSDITARIGGEEFIVFVQGMSEHDIITLSMKIRSAIDELKIMHACANVSNYVTVSMGAALIVPEAGSSFHNLYEKADKALYDAKANGRNCVVFQNRIYGRMKKGAATLIAQ